MMPAAVPARGRVRGHLRARRVVEVRQRHARQPLIDRALDAAQARLFLGRHERDRRARRRHARRAVDAVDVVLRRGRHVEVDDMAERGDVDAARGDVGRDQHAVLPALEAGERLGALRLRPVAVDALHLHAVLAEVLREPVRAVLRAREDERVLHAAVVQQPDEQRRLQVLRHRIRRVRDADGRRRLALEIDRRRLLQHLARQLRDRRRHGRAEEQRLSPRRQVAQHAADVGQEAHVEHPVRFVEDEIAQAGELRVRPREVIEQPSGRADDHVHSAPERVLLRPHADAAEDGGRADRRVDGEVVEILDDLRRQLSRRRQHERARRPARLRDEAVQDGQQERRGLAAAGHCAREQIPSAERQRNRVGLNRGGTREPEVFEAFQQIGMEAEARKRHGSL